MTTIQILQSELTRIQQTISECVSEDGYIMNHCKYKYSMLVEKARAFKESIEFLKELRNGI